jgi:ABC-type Fe3+ transport system permease subunit
MEAAMPANDNNRRTPRDYMNAARSRYDNAGSSVWIGVGLAVLTVIVYMLFAATVPRTIDDGTARAPTTTSTPKIEPDTK